MLPINKKQRIAKLDSQIRAKDTELTIEGRNCRGQGPSQAYRNLKNDMKKLISERQNLSGLKIGPHDTDKAAAYSENRTRAQLTGKEGPDSIITSDNA